MELEEGAEGLLGGHGWEAGEVRRREMLSAWYEGC
jgi:hypothetical protein